MKAKIYKNINIAIKLYQPNWKSCM